MNKKGLFEVIVMVLLILFVLAAVVIIWSFAKVFVFSGSSKVDVGQFSTSFSIVKDSFSDENGVVKFSVRRGAGEVDVVEIDVVLEDSEGDTCVVPQLLGEGELKPLESKTFVIDYGGLVECSDVRDVVKISIAPVFSSAGGQLIKGGVSDSVKTSDFVEGSECTDTCQSLEYECGTQTVCGVSTYCGTCSSGTCQSGECIVALSCGNGYTDLDGVDNNIGSVLDNEQCDDGNLIDGDGCSSTCQIEEGWRCALTEPNSQCVEVTMTSSDGADCSLDDFGITPLSDLGSGTYAGFEGGLYPGGVNIRPSAHEGAGVSIANSIQPLDANGNVDLVNGKIVMISSGVSNTNYEFDEFIKKAQVDPEVNSKLVLVNGATPAMVIDRWRDPSDTVWTNSVSTALANAGVTWNQVQIVWAKHADDPRGDFLTAAEDYQNGIEEISRVYMDKFPNLKLAYFSSRTRAYRNSFPDDSAGPAFNNGEFYAYETGFAVKWMIEKQINGDSSSLNYNDGTAPWLSWGPYIWADGINQRSDGFNWICGYVISESDVRKSDGIHPVQGRDGQGARKVADKMMEFFKTDTTTRPWFLE